MLKFFTDDGWIEMPDSGFPQNPNVGDTVVLKDPKKVRTLFVYEDNRRISGKDHMYPDFSWTIDRRPI